MNFAIAGNNDGPLFLLRSLRGEKIQPLFVALQKPVSPVLREEYLRYIDPAIFFEGIDENELIKLGEQFRTGFLFNVFCNFRFATSLEKYTILNIHPASLPRYRGRHPMHWALINGEKEFAITIHKMEKEIDAGEIYWQQFVKIKKGMSVRELRSDLMHVLEENFPVFLKKFAAGKIKSKPNSEKKASYVARRYPEDSLVKEWNDSSLIIRKVMALRDESNPAFIKIKGKQVPLSFAQKGKRKYEAVPVPFISRKATDGFEIACLDGNTIFFSGIDPKEHDIQLNDRIEI
jgi:methionyl-tRNA formyltransferase